MAGEDREYCAWIRTQNCLMEGHGECSYEMHAHHPQGGKGLGTRNHDHRTVPLCSRHHTERHSLSGPFNGWDKPKIRSWESTAAESLRRVYLGLGPDAPLDF